MPVVSVVLIFLNEERFIEDAVQSVIDQTLEDWELVLVDDGSVDGSTSIARNLAAGNERIEYVEHSGHENRGMSASRNLGVAHTRAPYIAFIDADDVWAPTKLAEQVELMAEMPDVALICGARLRWHSWDPATSKPDETVRPGGFADRRLDVPDAALMLRPLGRGQPSAIDLLVRRTVFESVGGFEERFRGYLEDQAFLFKVFLRYPVYISSRTWLRYRRHNASCVAQISRTELLRHRDFFLGWLQEDDRRLADPRVRAAVRRRQREILVRRLLTPAFAVFDRLPTKFRRYVRRAIPVRRKTMPAGAETQSVPLATD